MSDVVVSLGAGQYMHVNQTIPNFIKRYTVDRGEYRVTMSRHAGASDICLDKADQYLRAGRLGDWLSMYTAYLNIKSAGA